MMRGRAARIALAVWLALTAAIAFAEPSEIDAESGLVVAPGWRLVRAHCGACHSLQLVTSQRGDRDYWLGLIRWMQRTQNLWDLPPEIEDRVLDYLAAHYDETEWGRRPPLPARLRPEPAPAADTG